MTNVQIAAVYIGLHILLLVYLAIRVAGRRRGESISVGTGGDSDMELRMRVHGNAAEYIPMAMIGLLAMALLDLPVWALHLAGLSLIIGRVSHAIGLGKSIMPARVLGMVLTWLPMLGVAVALFYAAFT